MESKVYHPILRPSISAIQIAAFLMMILFLMAACSSVNLVKDQEELPAGLLTPRQEPGDSGSGQEPDQDSASVDQTPEALSAAVSGINPCDLLTNPEIEAALGEPLSSSDRSTVFNYESCSYQGQGGGKFIILQVTRQTAEQFKTDNQESSAMFEADLIPVENLGDEAAFYSGLLRVRVGETVVQIATWHPEDELDQALALAQDLARKAISRLPQ